MQLREQILSQQDQSSEVIEVPEWTVDGAPLKVGIRSLTAGERADIFGRATDFRTRKMDLGRAYPEIAIAGCFDPETGDKVFEAADREAIAGKSGAALDRIVVGILKLSGLDKEGTDDLGNA